MEPFYPKQLSHSHCKMLLYESAIPEEVRRRQAWCPFKFEIRNGKRTKVPYDARTGGRAKSNKPETWSSFEEAFQATKSSEYDGIQYILSGEDPYFLLDLDGVRNPATGEITPEAHRIIAPFEGKAFIEISASGKGIHVFGRGEKPGAEWCRNSALGIELYDWGRPVVFTGNVSEISGSELADCQDELDRLYYEFMPEHLKNKPDIEQEPPPDPVDLPDEELLQKASNSKYGEEFRALWAGDTSVTDGDHSRADHRLMKTLLFWTGGDEGRAIDLFDRSGLARRDKWRRRPDYRNRTARRARMSLTKFYRGTGKKTPKDQQHEKALRDLRSRWWDFDWSRLVGTGERPNSMRGHTCRDVLKVIIDEAELHGEVVESGVRVSLGRREIALRGATSLRTTHKSIKHLEAEGWLKFEPAESEEKPGSYLLNASLHHTPDLHSEGGGGREKLCGGGGEGLRSPRLRWSAPNFERVGNRVERGHIRRLGKIAGSIIDLLLDRGGDMNISELSGMLNKRPYDLRRRNLPKLIEAGVVEVEDSMVRLTDDWLEALEFERELKGEIEAEERDRNRYRRQHEAFRRRNEIQPDDHYVNAGADGYVEELRSPRPNAEPEESQKESVVSELARAIRKYLDRSPYDACQPPGWIGTTLWAFDLFDGKPTPGEVRAAIEELGGQEYLRSRLSAADGRAA